MRNLEIVNKKAYFDYFIEDTLECGIELLGNEVKSIRASMVNLKGSWIDIINNELFVMGMHITPWETSNRFDIKKDRCVRLLAHKREIRKLKQEAEQQGVTIVPLKLYTKDNKVKMLIGVARGKHLYDKRQSIKEREAKLEINRREKVCR